MPKAAKKPPTKTQIIASIAETTGVAKKDVAAVFEALADEIKKNLGSRGAGSFTIPGLLKIVKQKVPAKPGKNAPDPFNPGQFRDYPAKPAYNKVRLRALKSLKEMAL